MASCLLSGFRRPYPGKLGVAREGAQVDLLLVDGDPIENIKLIDDPANSFVVIMKKWVDLHESFEMTRRMPSIHEARSH